jgi:uncharacterized protein Usg
MNDFEYALNGYRLTTVEIIYRLPDYPDVLQTYVWQEYDYPPNFPRLKVFLSFWQEHIEGKLYAVTLSCRDGIAPQNFSLPAMFETLH